MIQLTAQQGPPLRVQGLKGEFSTLLLSPSMVIPVVVDLILWSRMGGVKGQGDLGLRVTLCFAVTPLPPQAVRRRHPVSIQHHWLERSL